MSVVTLRPADEADSPRSGAVASAIRIAMEAQQGRTFLWWAPALAAGIGLYFAAPAEPSLLLAAGIAGAGLLLVWLGRTAPLVLLAGVVALGFALAKLQAVQSGGPLLSSSMGEVTVTGRVVSLDRSSANRMIMILAPASVEGLTPERTPLRLRLSIPHRPGLPVPGAQVSFKARLGALPSPVEPGGFDYGRTLWLDGIGGTGRITSGIVTLAAATPFASWLDLWLSDVRAAMGERIHAALAEPYASFAEALITGERSNIPPEINRSLLVSGLYHILSISGLHMWLAAGGVYWVLRAGLALVPVMALRFPIRKWAASAALLMALFYMLLAQGGVATARAFIMVAIVFFAILVDRPALSMRNLALAAVAILVIDPEGAIEASFQMSFLAVLGLVAFYEAWARYRTARSGGAEPPHRHWAVRIMFWGASAMAASLVTSFIAGFSSSLAASYHFGRIAPYGVLANGLAVPVVGILIMPFGLAAALLMPLGLERLPLIVMGKGLELLVAISDGVASLPGANEVIARPPAIAVVIMAAGLVLLCLLKGPVRLAGLGVMAMGGLLVFSSAQPPDLLIEAAGRNITLRDAQGRLVPALPRRARFAVEKWLQSNGEEAGLKEAANRPGWTCSPGRCVAVVRARRVIFLTGGEGKPVDCGGAQVLIADFPLRGACRSVPLKIDRFDLWRHGAHAVWLGQGQPEVRTARGEQGIRPWVVTPEPRRHIDGAARWAHERHP